MVSPIISVFEAFKLKISGVRFSGWQVSAFGPTRNRIGERGGA